MRYEVTVTKVHIWVVDECPNKEVAAFIAEQATMGSFITGDVKIIHKKKFLNAAIVQELEDLNI